MANSRRRTAGVAITGVAVVLCAAASFAQATRPPIPGATGVIRPEGSGDGATDAIEAVAEKTAEGTRNLLKAMGLAGKDDGFRVETLKALELGQTVVVRYATNLPAGHEATQSTQATQSAQTAPAGSVTITEGRVIELDRKKGTVVVRLPDKTTERLRLVESRERESIQAGDATKDAAGMVSLSYVDAKGERIVILFRKSS